MRIISITGLLLALLLSINVFAGTEKFEQRFKLVRKDGRLTQIIDQGLEVKFSIKPYIQFIKKQIIEEQFRMQAKGDYEEEIRSLFNHNNGFMSDADARRAGNASRANDSENVAHIVDSLKELEKIDIEAIFNDSKFQEVISKYENKLSDALNMINPKVLASLDNSTYFYKRNVTYQVLNWGLSFAKKRLSSVPVLNTASFILVQVEKMIRERRLYHQNILLHYFETYTAEELGLTLKEVDHAYSSVYESRIPWFGYFESKRAVANWDRFGADKFYDYFRMGTSKYRLHKDIFTNLGGRLNYAFQDVEFNGEKVIINLFNSQDMINSRPAIAFNYDNPKKVQRFRMILQLAQLGISFLPLPAMVKNISEMYMKSHYEQQQITEGALFGYFESNDNLEMLRKLRTQYINPFDTDLML